MAKRFVLVHEAGHGSWSWSKVKERLEREGHRVNAIDLADAQSCVNIIDYFQPLFNFMNSLQQGEKVILVGHGRAGLAISVATERYRQYVSIGVYVAALTPSPTFPISEVTALYNPQKDFYMDSTVEIGYDGKITSILFGPRFLRQNVYHLSPEKDLQNAINSTRKYPYFDDERSAEELKLTDDSYGSVPRFYIKCVKDKMIPIDVQKQMIDRNPPSRGVEEIFDSDHMPMDSKPEELARHLHLIAQGS